MNNLSRADGLTRLQNLAHVFEPTPKICGGDHHSPYAAKHDIANAPNMRRRKTFEAWLRDQEVSNLLVQLDKWTKPTVMEASTALVRPVVNDENGNAVALLKVPSECSRHRQHY